MGSNPHTDLGTFPFAVPGINSGTVPNSAYEKGLEPTQEPETLPEHSTVNLRPLSAATNPSPHKPVRSTLFVTKHLPSDAPDKGSVTILAQAESNERTSEPTSG